MAADADATEQGSPWMSVAESVLNCVQGIFTKAAGAPALMPQLQLVFDESAEQLARAATPESRQAELATPSEPGAPAERDPSAAPQAANGIAPAANGRKAVSAATAAAESGNAQAAAAGQPSSAHGTTAARVKQPQRTAEVCDGEELDYGDDEDYEAMEEIVMDTLPGNHSSVAAEQKGASSTATDTRLPPGPAVGPAIGLAMGPLSRPPDAAEINVEVPAADGDARGGAAPPPRTAGPAMPPPELLAAAQEAALAVRCR